MADETGERSSAIVMNTEVKITPIDVIAALKEKRRLKRNEYMRLWFKRNRNRIRDKVNETTFRL